MAIQRKYEDDQPWYKQFWPWFIIALPATAVVASMHLVYTAMQDKPDMVISNYYKEGLAINEEIGAEKLADQLNLNADMLVKQDIIEIKLDGELQTLPLNLALTFQHPIKENLDRVIIATRGADNVYRSTESVPQQRWYLMVEGMDESTLKLWKLKGVADFNDVQQITLTHRPL